MKHPTDSSKSAAAVITANRGTYATQLRLYVARWTPNSTRAELNLLALLKELDGDGSIFRLEIVDVFTHSKRAIIDGVIVTPTLIGLRGQGRMTMMGDLTDGLKLRFLLESLREPPSD
jgi:hypothetical protein